MREKRNRLFLFFRHSQGNSARLARIAVGRFLWLP